MTPPQKPENESPEYKLLCDVRATLHAGLAEKWTPGAKMAENYLYKQAECIRQLLDGYMYLQLAKNIRAARTIIRPSLEAAFKMQAVGKRPAYLYNIAQTEHKGDAALVKVAIDKGEYTPEPASADHPAWEQAKLMFKAQFPDSELSEHAASAYDCAKVAGLTALYDFQYRLYCNSSHSALRASTDEMPGMDKLDNLTMARCGLVGLSALGSLGISMPTYTQLADRYKVFDAQIALPSVDSV